jgi:hypothetical protein
MPYHPCAFCSSHPYALRRRTSSIVSKPNQVISPGPPPKAPTQFNPDPNVLVLPTNLPPSTNWSRAISIASNAPPQAPFNPDPGASLKQGSRELAPPVLFPSDVVLPPTFTPPSVPPEQALPRPDVRRGEILPPPPPSAGSFGLEPLPKDQALPREDVRRNLKIEQNFHVPAYSSTTPPGPTNSEPRPDRWRIGFTPWKRYTSGVTEQPYETPEPLLWHPYKQSVLKGDAPVIGQDIFLNLTASTQTEVEFRRVPTAAGVSAAVPGAYEFYGESEQIGIQNNIGFAVELFKGETAFKPVEWAIRLEPVFNVNYLDARETGVVSPDPRGSIGGNDNRRPPGNGFVLDPSDIDALLNGQVGPADSFRAERHTERTRTFFALQQAFGELHLRDLSDNYDFLALRGGLQPFNSDFRGFIFNDVNLGARIFGNWGNNRYQYNLAVFDMREKDSNSDLNSLDDRKQEVIVANLLLAGFSLERLHRAMEPARKPRPGRNPLRSQREHRPARAHRHRARPRRQCLLPRLGRRRAHRAVELVPRVLSGLRTRRLQRSRGTTHGHQRPDGRHWSFPTTATGSAIRDHCSTLRGMATPRTAGRTVLTRSSTTRTSPGARSAIGRARASTSAARW